MAKILPRQTVQQQEAIAAKLLHTGPNPIRPQTGFITPRDINRIYSAQESDPFVYGVEAYFNALRGTTEAYMTALDTPESLSLTGQRTLRRICSRCI
jgi:hypothetical protein